MAKLPPQLEMAALDEVPSLRNYLVQIGKVRNLYRHPDFPEQLLMVARNTLSIFDFVLPCLVPDKGDVLTALTHFWLTRFGNPKCHHLVNSSQKKLFNAAVDWQDQFPDIPLGRSLAIKEIKLFDFELIFRMHLGGSVWKEYEQTGRVAGQELPAGLSKWQKLPEPLFTPSTKSQSGHDVNITIQDFLDQAGESGRRTMNFLANFYKYYYHYAANRGILILDTKFEAGNAVVADEVLTPDSSRFTTTDDFHAAQTEQRDPIFYDKQPVRNWGATIQTPFGSTGLKSLDPEDSNHQSFVHSLEIQAKIIAETRDRYREIFQRLTQMKLEDYQRQHLGLAA